MWELRGTEGGEDGRKSPGQHVLRKNEDIKAETMGGCGQVIPTEVEQFKAMTEAGCA